MSNWRGLSVVMSWLFWPAIAIILSFPIFGFEGQCAVDNCSDDYSLLNEVFFVVYVFSVPVVASLLYISWRKTHNKKIKRDAQNARAPY